MNAPDADPARRLTEARLALSHLVEALERGASPSAPSTREFERCMTALAAALGAPGSSAGSPREREGLRDLLRVAQHLTTRELERTSGALSGVRAARERLGRQRERLDDARNCDVSA